MSFLTPGACRTCPGSSFFTQPRKVACLRRFHPDISTPLRRVSAVSAKRSKDDKPAEDTKNDENLKWRVLSLTKAELLKELKARDCDISGLKSALQERLLKNLIQNDMAADKKVDTSELPTMNKSQLALLCAANGLPKPKLKSEIIAVLRDFYGYPQEPSPSEVAARSINESTTHAELLMMNTSVLQIACRENRLPYSTQKGKNVETLLNFMKSKGSMGSEDATSDTLPKSRDESESTAKAADGPELSEEYTFALNIVAKMTMSGICSLKKKDLISLLSHAGVPTDGSKGQIVANFKKLYVEATLASRQRTSLKTVEKVGAEQAVVEEIPEQQTDSEGQDPPFEEVYEEQIAPPEGKLLVDDPSDFLVQSRRSVYQEYGEHLDANKDPDYKPLNSDGEEEFDALGDLDDVGTISEDDVQHQTRSARASSSETKRTAGEKKQESKQKGESKKGNEAIVDPLSTDPSILSSGRTSRRRPLPKVPPLQEINPDGIDIGPSDLEATSKGEGATDENDESREAQPEQKGVDSDTDLVGGDSDVDVNVMTFETVPESVSCQEEENDVQIGKSKDGIEPKVQDASDAAVMNPVEGTIAAPRKESIVVNQSDKDDLEKHKHTAKNEEEGNPVEGSILKESDVVNELEEEMEQVELVEVLTDQTMGQSESNPTEESGSSGSPEEDSEDEMVSKSNVNSQTEGAADLPTDSGVSYGVPAIPEEFKNIEGGTLLYGMKGEDLVAEVEEKGGEDLRLSEQVSANANLLGEDSGSARALEEEKKYLNKQHDELKRVRQEIERKKEAMMDLQKQVDSSVLRQKEGYSQIQQVAKLTQDMMSQRLEWQEKAQGEMEILKIGPEKIKQNEEEKENLGESIAYLQETCDALDNELQEKDQKAEDLSAAVNSENAPESPRRSGNPRSENDKFYRDDSKSPLFVGVTILLAMGEAVRSIWPPKEKGE